MKKGLIILLGIFLAFGLFYFGHLTLSKKCLGSSGEWVNIFSTCKASSDEETCQSNNLELFPCESDCRNEFRLCSGPYCIINSVQVCKSKNTGEDS